MNRALSDALRFAVLVIAAAAIVMLVLLAISLVFEAASAGWHHYSPKPEHGWVSYPYYWSGRP